MTKKCDRIKAVYENKSSNFLVTVDSNDDGFRKQFYFLYRARIDLITPKILDNAKKIFGYNIQPTQLSDVSKSCDCLVIGVILKKMKYRRSVLFDFQDEETLNFEFREKLNSNCLVSDNDVLEFEGDQQIVKLTGNIDKDRFVTGNVVGLYGHITKDDFFEVNKIIFPTLALQIKWPLLENDCYVAFLSGISLNSNISENRNVLCAFEKLINWLCAEVNLLEEELNIVKNINRLVIAGESIRISNMDVETRRVEFLGLDQDIDKDAIGQFDKLLSRLLSTIYVDVMSGSNDPTSLLLPQQPMPRLVFPWARRFGKLLNMVTNPYKFSLNGVTFFGTSGQDINDLSRLTLGQSPLELMHECLLRGQIFPTVPDSIDGFPLQRRDPFIVDEMPHVFFAGNQKHFGKMWMNSKELKTKFNSSLDCDTENKTLLLTIPIFKNKLTLVLLNLRNMRVFEYDFSQKNLF